jgi:hypothetical protein
MCCSCSQLVKAQSVFFHTEFVFSEKQMSSFFSSCSMDSSQLYFNANDFNVYGVDKNSGKINWSFYSANKSNIAPIAKGKLVFVEQHVSENGDNTVLLHANTGLISQTLKMQSLSTLPMINDSIMYCAAIDEDGGAMMAYDLNKNSVLWKHFIAHGISRQPYFFKDKIIANAEGDNWIEMDYSGKILSEACRSKASKPKGDAHCIRHFSFLTHNQKPILGKDDGDYMQLSVMFAAHQTVQLREDNLLFFDDKAKMKQIPISSIVELSDTTFNDYQGIFKIDQNIVWFFYQNQLAAYDFLNDKTIHSYDLSRWNVHQLLLDGNKAWLISKNDGQLYGLILD